MFFWIGILFGVLFAWLAMKIGFYDTFVYFVNTLISIYLALFVTPLLLHVIPEAGDIPYSTMVTTAVVGVGSFLLLYAIAYMLLIGQFKVSFSKAFDTIFGGLFGFLTGFLVLSFITILAYTTSLPQVTHFIEKNAIKSNVSYICWWCDHIHGLIGTDDITQPSRNAIQKLKDLALEEQQRKAVLNSTEDSNNPAVPNDQPSGVQAE